MPSDMSDYLLDKAWSRCYGVVYMNAYTAI